MHFYEISAAIHADRPRIAIENRQGTARRDDVRNSRAHSTTMENQFPAAAIPQFLKLFCNLICPALLHCP
jgi:hypothetical protein